MINASEIAETILSIAKKQNCGVQITIVESDSKDISVREGKIEHLLSSVAISSGVRLFKGKKSAIISFSGDEFDDMELKIKTVLDSIDYLGDDEAKRLLTAGEFGEGVKDLDLNDHNFDNIILNDIKICTIDIYAGIVSRN